jgi:hypothetical protein
MKTYKMTRVYETYIEVEDGQELGDKIYAMELEQCNVVYEKIELQYDKMNREQLIEWLCANDPNGVYRDEDSIREGMDVLTYEQALELYLTQSEG